MQVVKMILCAVVVFLLMDAMWLGFVAKHFYINQLGGLLRMSGDSISARILPAIIVYLALIIGILVFVVPHASSALQALLLGALFGFVTYATYDFTNLAVLKDWNWVVSLVDVAWGMVICGVTSGLTFVVGH
jgi:uncharacterized membrane protein